MRKIELVSLKFLPLSVNCLKIISLVIKYSLVNTRAANMIIYKGRKVTKACDFKKILIFSVPLTYILVRETNTTKQSFEYVS